MPNWCQNILTITGNVSELKKFYEENKTDESELSFNKGVPIPENSEDWYDLNCENWGTKWDACEVYTNDTIVNEEYICDIGEELIYEFDTAWSPPHPWLKTISQKYNTLKFELVSEESGWDFWCSLIIENGEIKEDISIDLSTRKMNILKSMYPFYEILGRFLEILHQLETIEECSECDEINEMLLEYEINEYDDDWHTFVDYFYMVNEKIEAAREKYKKIIQKRKLRKFLHFCKKQEMHNQLMEFHTCPPMGEKLLKNGGFIYRELEASFYS